MGEGLGALQPGVGVPSESPVILARRLGRQLYEYALTQQYIVRDTGEGLADLRAQVAHLEAANAALVAALRAALNILKEAGLHDGPGSDDWLAAALSDGGEGWLPPEVREQARQAIKHQLQNGVIHYKDEQGTCFRTCVGCPLETELLAALDALKGE